LPHFLVTVYEIPDLFSSLKMPKTLLGTSCKQRKSRIVTMNFASNINARSKIERNEIFFMTVMFADESGTSACRTLYKVREAVSGSPILLFDRHHPSAPTCTRLMPARTVAVKDGPSSGHRGSGAQRP
jgi:hypothetical protein